MASHTVTYSDITGGAVEATCSCGRWRARAASRDVIEPAAQLHAGAGCPPAAESALPAAAVAASLSEKFVEALTAEQ